MMNMRKTIAVFLAAICIVVSFGVCAVSASDGARTVYATTSNAVSQGSGGYLYVRMDDLSDLASLSVSVYFDADKIRAVRADNEAACQLYDSSIGDGCVQFSYIFDGEGSSTPTDLFCLYYEVEAGAALGDTYFDIVVSEAYSTSLEALPVYGSRCAFEITKKAPPETCVVYADSNIFTSVEEEFDISYRLGTREIASGSFVVTYDPERFEVVSYLAGGLLSNKITDVNTSCPGSLYVSFVGLEYASSSDLITVTFKTIKNIEEESDIKLNVTEFCDLDLNRFSCAGASTSVSISYDDTYIKDRPAMRVDAVYSKDTGKVIATIILEKDSMLGAGDFELCFDPGVLTYESYEKEFAPTFFNVNDKAVDEGSFKFMIVSLEDIIEAQTVITVVFDVQPGYVVPSTRLDLSGSGLTDSMTNDIVLYLEGTDVTLPRNHIHVDVKGDIDYTASADSVTVSGDAVVRVGYAVDGSYVAIDAKSNGDGSYSFEVPQEVSEVVVVMLGDFNGNGKLTAADCAMLNAHILGKIDLPDALSFAYDINNDGAVDRDDVSHLVNAILGRTDLEW